MDQGSSQIPGSKDDTEFDDLLRSAKVEVPLPGTFQVEVWRRIAAAQEASFTGRISRCLQGIIGVLVRPVAATTAVLVMILAGVWFGSIGDETVRDGKSAYIESVSPFAHSDHGQPR